MSIVGCLIALVCYVILLVAFYFLRYDLVIIRVYCANNILLKNEYMNIIYWNCGNMNYIDKI